VSPTITEVVYPFVLIVEAYNEAGERVKLIGEATVNSNDLGGVMTLVNGKEETVFDPSKGEMTFRFPGILSIDDPAVNYIDFKWDGRNENGQDINQGVYYIKIRATDAYGHVNTTVKEVSVLKTEEYIRVSIYNTAGELVRRMEQEKTPGSITGLEINSVVYIDENSGTTIKIGTTDSMQWDGKNSFGDLVASGLYEVQLEVKDESGYTVFSTQTITVLNNGSREILGEIKAFPNPSYIGEEEEGTIRIQWTGIGEGTVTVRIYNIAAEMCAKITSRIQDGHADWNVKNMANSRMAGGYYVAVIEANEKGGMMERRIVKLVVVRR